MLCTFPGGGASIAARRQAEALRRAGCLCHFAFIEHNDAGPDIAVEQREDEIVLKVPRDVWDAHVDAGNGYCEGNRTAISNTLFTFWSISTYWDDTLLKICKRYDVIHLHWIAWMVSSAFLQRLSVYDVRIVITSHDMAYFTGGCHYSAGCQRYEVGCSDCPQLQVDPLGLVANSYHEKLSAVAALRATWLFPSLWLAESFKKSRTWSADTPLEVLYNCIDTDRFAAIDQEQRNLRRQEFGFRSDELVLVAGASDMNEARKGFEVIARAVENLQDFPFCADGERYCVTIVTFGINESFFDSPSMRLRHVHLGKINEDVVIRLLQASDLLLFPSLEENFSNTILESLMCACPVLAFNIGGIPDIVEDEINGWLVNNVSKSDFSKKLQSVLRPEVIKNIRLSTKTWRDRHAKNYDYGNASQALLRVYGDCGRISRSFSLNHTASRPRLSDIYAALFGALACQQAMPQSSLSSALKRQVRLALGGAGPTPAPRVLLTIPVGFDHAEENETIGDIFWLHKEAHLLFKGQEDMRPALCLQIPNEKWIADISEEANKLLCATCNGDAVKLSTVRDDQSSHFLYFWLIPSPASLKLDSFNKLSLSFSKYTVPLTNDSRGLCLLYKNAYFIDLNDAEFSTNGQAPNTCADSAAACVTAKAIYEINIDNNPDKKQHFLNNAVDTWLDIL